MLAITPWCLGLALLLCGCTTVKRGVVVGKGSRVEPARFPRVENYWVDVRGEGGHLRQFGEQHGSGGAPASQCKQPTVGFAGVGKGFALGIVDLKQPLAAAYFW